MGIRKFSVGKIIADGSPIGVATNITVRHDGNPQEFRGGDFRFPLEIEPGDQSLIVTAETADFDANNPDFDSTFTLELQAGANSGGLVVTFTNMKLVTAEVTSTQNTFVGTRLEWRKKDIEV